ncbi:MAG: hypothetical protein ACJ790_22465 [Myxococcaceae bacterium]
MRLLAAIIVLCASSAWAFDYVEHSYMTDRACLLAQQRAAATLDGDETKALRYLALSLTCPEQWTRPYCAEGYKQLEGSLNRLDAPPDKSHDYSITLGDFSALQDHLAELGAVKGVPQAVHDGLSSRLYEWLSTTGDAGGVASDVAEDGCETQRPIDWPRLLAEPTESDAPLSTSILQRSPAEKVVSDPAGAYSFDNPQYLDLVLHNHGHFGTAAFRNWQGLHATAIDLEAASCEQLIPESCDALAEKLQKRVAEWSQRATPELVKPVATMVSTFDHEKAKRLLPILTSLVFESAGLHYLQDSLSGGHVRLDRSAYGLADSRYQHDQDSRNGLPTPVSIGGTTRNLVLFGDGYLLGGESGDCASNVTPCLLREQRSVVLGTTTASLLQWLGADPSYVQSHQLSASPSSTPASVALGAPPNPPPPFSYQSLLLSTSIDAAGGPPQIGVRAVFLSALGSRANWMTSYHFGLLTRVGQGHTSQVTTEFSYMFHWRWAARWLINMGPYAFAGVGGLGQSSNALAGVGPSVGTSLLPEGWIHLPLELTFSYRLPIRLYDGRYGLDKKSVGIEAHWIEIAMGLAFM